MMFQKLRTLKIKPITALFFLMILAGLIILKISPNPQIKSVLYLRQTILSRLGSTPTQAILKLCPQCHQFGRLFVQKTEGDCLGLAINLLQKKQAPYLLSTCTGKMVAISGTSNYLTFIYAVAGEDPGSLEHECGYFIPCVIYRVWFDQSGNIVEGPTERPDYFINHDPNVNINGCVSSWLELRKIDRELVLEGEQYLWKTNYNNTIVSHDWGDCILNGTSYFNDVMHRSDVIMEFKPKVTDCKSYGFYSTCRDALSYITNSAEHCILYNPNNTVWTDQGCVDRFNARQMKK